MTGICQSTQKQIKCDYPGLKVADPCPGCGELICRHSNPVSAGNYLI